MMFDKLIDVLLQFIGFFKFWRVIPYDKVGVKIRWGKNPEEMEAGFHWVAPFEIDHVEAFVIKPEWNATTVIHVTTKDGKTITCGPILEYRITDVVKWRYEVNDAASNLQSIVRFCVADILTDCDWEECMRKPIWTRIKNKIKERTKDLGIEIDDFGLIDLAISRIIITSV